LLAASLAGDSRGLEYIPRSEAQLSSSQFERAKQRAKELQATRISIAEVAFVQ